MTTAAKTNDVTIVAAVNEELNTIQSALPEVIRTHSQPVIVTHRISSADREASTTTRDQGTATTTAQCSKRKTTCLKENMSNQLTFLDR